MLRQKQWSIHEAVILLDELLHYKDNQKPRMDAIHSVSKQLRRMAENRGQMIDDTYRNTNGISFQMASMESALAGHTIMKPATRLFTEVVEIYRNDPAGFKKLLEEAKVMISGNQVTNEVEFMTWLASKVSPAQLNEDQALTLAEQVKSALRQECESNSYGTTVTYLQGRLSGASATEIKKILEDAPWAIYTFGTWKYQEVESRVDSSEQTSDEDKNLIVSAAKESEVLTVDFENIPPLVYTKPVSFSYFEETTDGLRSWADLYVKLFSVLYEDYPHRLHIGTSFTANGDGRIEFGDASMIHAMVAPKAIPTPNDDKLYLETNLSANHLVGKIKFLLNLCSVDYENVVIKYKSKQDDSPSNGDFYSPMRSAIGLNVSPAIPFSDKTEVYSEGLVAGFISWMISGGTAPATTRNYTGAIRSAEEYAKAHSFSHQILFTEEHGLAVMTTSELFADEGFIEYNRRQHNRFRAAITKLLEYYGVDYSFKRQKYAHAESAEKAAAPEAAIETKSFRAVLASKFVRGFRIGSPLDMKKFRRYYEVETGQELSLANEETEQAIRASGIQYNGKVYVPDVMLPTEIREKLFGAIREGLAGGKKAIYYEALFRSFSESFLDYYIYDADMLKAYIAFYNKGEFHMGNQYISKDAGTEVNPVEEVKNYLAAAGRPIESEEICETLSHIPQKKVMQILGTNSEFIHNGRSNGKGSYFHVSILHLTEEELDHVSTLIADAIDGKTFVSGNELLEMIQARYPYILESNPLISMMGMRDALKYHLGNRFSFKGNIISDPTRAISMADVFGNYARTHTAFTMAELKNLAVEMNASVYLDAVYDNSLRISKEQFVSKEYAQFRIEDTDRVIARFCTGSFIPIGNIREFGTFPDAGYPWTAFLLEQYVYGYSKQFKLLHAGFNRECSVGAIVRKEAGIDQFNDLLSIALGESATPIKKDNALSFFVVQGYLARRNYSDIEKVLIQANTYRNRKGTK